MADKTEKKALVPVEEETRVKGQLIPTINKEEEVLVFSFEYQDSKTNKMMHMEILASSWSRAYQLAHWKAERLIREKMMYMNAYSFNFKETRRLKKAGTTHSDRYVLPKRAFQEA